MQPAPTPTTDQTDAREFLQLADTTLLARLARGEIDLNALARQELASRGCDGSGCWVGFDAAAQALGIAQ
jgi:hypothetical protein